jgi:DUF971 family protein
LRGYWFNDSNKCSDAPAIQGFGAELRKWQAHIASRLSFLRVLSPSAEVRGHGPGQETLQTGKRDVGINELEPVGHYAIRPMFSDGHDSGLFSWEYLYFLCENQDALWNDYLDKLKQAGASRDVAAAQTGHEGHSCGNK